MKAVLCKAYGGPETLTVADVPPPPMKPGHVRVAIHAAGVNFPDTLIIRGKYQFKPEFPFSPGGEMAGVITETADDVTHLKVGDRVLAMSTWGAFAEEIVVPAFAAARIPDAMDYATAAGFIITYGTTYHALADRGRLRPGETLLVLGAAGGVGLAAVELGKALEARVIAAASTPEKLAVAKEHGADELIAYGTEDLKERVRALTDGKGADVIYDPVGGDATKAVLSAINWRGRLLIVGFASGTIPDIPANRALIKGCDIVGIFWGDYIRREPERFAQDFAELTRLYETGRIKPLVSATYPLEKAAEALNVIESRKAVGKIVLKVR
jgi:NADPH2:quinone reductase